MCDFFLLLLFIALTPEAIVSLFHFDLLSLVFMLTFSFYFQNQRLEDCFILNVYLLGDKCSAIAAHGCDFSDRRMCWVLMKKTKQNKVAFSCSILSEGI